MALTSEHVRSITPVEVARPIPLPGIRGRIRSSSAHWVTPAVLLAADTVALLYALIISGARGVAFAYVPLAVLCLAFSGAYRVRITLRVLDAVPWLVTRLALPLLILAPVLVITGADAEPLLLTALIAVGLVIPERIIAFGALRRVRRGGQLLEPAIILGAGGVGAELARAFHDYPEYGIEPIGFLDSVSGDLPYPVLGDVDRLDALLASGRVRRAIVAFGPAREAELVSVLRTAVQHHVDVYVVPRFFDCGVTPEGPDTDDVRGIPLYRVRSAALRAPVWYVKRFVDIVVSGTVLLLASPFLAIIALAVKLSSPGPVFFRQTRIGQYGQEIDVPKFRSLEINHDSDTRWSVDADPRVTAVGRILRRTSLDELPQLWSVLKGDMSLVGPRPERPFFVERFGRTVDGYADRHRLPVGLTGWAQVHGLRGATSIEERARFDNQYIEHWSLWRDVIILVRTVAEVVRGARIDR
jgi:exopolysaccharide biosynthesis polyprenyl glycosylphosphotransferase